MSIARTSILTALVVTAATTAAQAQPGTTTPEPTAAPEPAPVPPPAPPAPAPVQGGTTSQPPPAGGDGSDVSTIKGQLVPVGDHNQYYYSTFKTNISANPLGWMLGLYGVSGSYAIHSNFAVRVDANYYNEIGDSDTHGFEIGAGIPIYFRRVYQGLFLEPGVMIRTMTNSWDDGSDTVVGPQALVGWHWMWDSGLNFAIAAGVGRNIDSDEEEYGTDEIFANGYMRFGYAF